MRRYCELDSNLRWIYELFPIKKEKEKEKLLKTRNLSGCEMSVKNNITLIILKILRFFFFF
jgi:hypothetical protein